MINELIEIQKDLLEISSDMTHYSQVCQDLYQDVLILLDKAIKTPNNIEALCNTLSANIKLQNQLEFELNLK